MPSIVIGAGDWQGHSLKSILKVSKSTEENRFLNSSYIIKGKKCKSMTEHCIYDKPNIVMAKLTQYI